MKQKQSKKEFKNNRKNQTKKQGKKKRNKKYKGGVGEKINFAYVYKIVNYQESITMRSLTDHLRRQDAMCNCVALNQNPCIGPTTTATDYIKPNQEIILFMKYSELVLIEQSNTSSPYTMLPQNILGHALIDYSLENSHNIIGIFNVCLHREVVPQSAPAPPKTGYGSVLFNLILTYLEIRNSQSSSSTSMIPTAMITGDESDEVVTAKNPLLWLGILVDNVNFDKVAHIYTSFGFGHPFVTYKYPFGTNDKEIVSLVKTLKYFPSIANKYIYHNTISMRNQYLAKKNGQITTYSGIFKFDKSFILKARLLPYIGTNGRMWMLDAKTSLSGLIREYFGVLKVYHSEEDSSGKIVYTLSSGNINFDDIEVGQESSVDVNNSGPFAYHTHPFGLYRKNNVLIAPPSGSDCAGFYSMSQGNKGISQCHFVVTIEGIYVLSFSDYVLNNFQQLFPLLVHRDIIARIQLLYEYPFDERRYNWSSERIGDDRTAVETAITKYIGWFNRQNVLFFSNLLSVRQQYPLFRIDFIRWKDLTTETTLTINIAPIYGSCFIPSSEYLIIQKLLGNKYSTNYNTFVPGSRSDI